MKKYFGSLAAMCLLFAGFSFAAPSTAAAQNNRIQPPPILSITREFVKPTAIGSAHQQSESAIAQAMAQANSPVHYTAWVSLTGKSRVLFTSGYASYADYQKAVETLNLGQGAAGQTFDRLQSADGKLLTQLDAAVFTYQPDMSVNAAVDISQFRFISIAEIRIRPGHDADWSKLAKLHNSVFAKIPGAHWAMYEMSFGSESGLYLAISPIKSLADIDAHRAAEKQAWAAASAEQKQQMQQLEQSTFKSVTVNLFAVDPNMSYVGEKWENADPGFWKQ